LVKITSAIGRIGGGVAALAARLVLRKSLVPSLRSSLTFPVTAPRGSRFGSPLVLSRVHWVRPELVAEVKFLTWTDDNLLRQVIYEGLREDKPAAEVRREAPHPKPATQEKPSARRW